MTIHSTAIISPEAEISPEADIGPFCVINGKVRIEAGTVLESHVRIGSRFGSVTLGERNYLQSGAALGGPPQDHSYDNGYESHLVLGDDNRIGEYVTITLGTEKGGGTTRIGSHNMLMAYVHIGHDCQVGNHVILTNVCQLAGHVIIEDNVLISGHTGVAQFARVGTCAYLVGGSRANKDIPPYTIAEGYWASLRAINKVGMRRSGIPLAERKSIEHALHVLFDRSATMDTVVERIRKECAPSDRIDHLVNFLQTSTKGIARR